MAANGLDESGVAQLNYVSQTIVQRVRAITVRSLFLRETFYPFECFQGLAYCDAKTENCL